MTTTLNWHTLPPGKLALLLQQSQLNGSRAVGASTVYHLGVDGREVLAVSLPDGQAVVIEAHQPPRAKRRRIDPPAAVS
jgi:hypothetical protein